MKEITNPYEVLSEIDLHKAEQERLSPAEYVRQYKPDVRLAPDPEHGTEQLAPADPDDADRTDADERAFQIMTGTDVAKMARERLSPAEYVQQYKGVDPADYGDSHEQLAAMRSAAQDAGDPR